MKKKLILTLPAVLTHFGLQHKDEITIEHMANFIGMTLFTEGLGNTYGKAFLICELELARDDELPPHTHIAFVMRSATGQEKICILYEEERLSTAFLLM